MTAREWLNALYPNQSFVGLRERLRGAAGGALGIGFTAFVSRLIALYLHLSPWLVAPLGASAVLVFAVPSSPLAQPWSVIGGNTLSAAAGLLACNLVPDPIVAASIAVGLAIGIMFTLRCLHPPGGAMALLVVLTHTHAPLFVIFPALTNSFLLVIAGIIYNSLTKKAYPHISAPSFTAQSGLMRITEADLAGAIAGHNEVIDIAPDDLARLLEESELRAYRRMAGHRVCSDIMTQPVFSVHFGTHLNDAWQLMQTHDIKALPVTDRKRRLHGLLTYQAFMDQALLLNPQDPDSGLKTLLTRTRTAHSDKPEVAGQIMSETCVTAQKNDPLDQLMPLFSRGDKRHVLIIDEERRLCGIISSSDMMQALFHSVVS